MRGVCAIYNNKALALVSRSGSYSLMLPMLQVSRESCLAEYTSDRRWHPVMNLHGHDLRNGFPQQPVACMVRDPIDRFCSACARQGKTAEEGIGLQESDVHFWSLRDMGLLEYGVTYFRFPSQINECAEWLGLPTSVQQENEEPEERKPVLTADELAAVRLAYADDIALYESLS
jgi:hypothetical protein